MENNDNTLIEKYFDGGLGKEEKAAFQNRLKKDASFKEAYDLRKSMAIFLEKESHQPILQTQFEQFGEEFFVEKKEAKVVPFYRKPLWIGLAASAAIIALILIVWNPFQAQNLYQQYAIHQPVALVEKSSAATIAAQAEMNFNQKHYEQAYRDLTAYLQQEKENPRAQLALGISALEIGKIEEATTIFTRLHQGSSLLKNSGTWYLALTYLKQEKFESSKQLLKQIPSSDTFLYSKAQELVSKIP